MSDPVRTGRLPADSAAQACSKAAWCRLEPLDAARHGAEIAAAFVGADERVGLSAGTSPQDRAAYETFARLDGRAHSTIRARIAVIDKADGQAKGHR